MKAIRWVLGRIILFLDRVFAPKARELSVADKQKIAGASGNLELYQFESCPFCVKVRRFMKAEGISITLVDATRDPARSELLKGGGKLQAPCLKISRAGGPAEWLYESDDIIAYLRKNVAAGSASA